MTGYGRSSKATALGGFVLKVHSVNRKMLDLSIYLPRDFLRFDEGDQKMGISGCRTGTCHCESDSPDRGDGAATFIDLFFSVKIVKRRVGALKRSTRLRF